MATPSMMFGNGAPTEEGRVYMRRYVEARLEGGETTAAILDSFGVPPSRRPTAQLAAREPSTLTALAAAESEASDAD